MDINEAAPTGSPSIRVASPNPTLKSAAGGSQGKAKVPKKEQMLKERAIWTKKRKDRRPVMRAKKAHQVFKAVTRVTTEMALDIM
jgi:hypothetical protein